LSLSRFKLPGHPTPRDTEASKASAVIPDSIGPVCMCSLIGINSSVRRCRIVKDRIRLWKKSVRDLVMARCCALHTFWVRLSPWQPMM